MTDDCLILVKGHALECVTEGERYVANALNRWREGDFGQRCAAGKGIDADVYVTVTEIQFVEPFAECERGIVNQQVPISQFQALEPIAQIEGEVVNMGDRRRDFKFLEAITVAEGIRLDGGDTLIDVDLGQ